MNGWLHVVFQCHGQLTTNYNRSWFFFIFSHTTYHLQWISFPPQGAKSDTKMIWINQDVFKSHVFFSHINFEVVHLSKSIQKYKLHIDLLVIQSKNTRVFEILPKPSMKKFTFSQSSGWKLTTLLFHSSEILFPASSTFSFTVSLISKPSIQFFLKFFFILRYKDVFWKCAHNLISTFKFHNYVTLPSVFDFSSGCWK